jgi:hypothetical protein
MPKDTAVDEPTVPNNPADGILVFATCPECEGDLEWADATDDENFDWNFNNYVQLSEFHDMYPVDCVCFACGYRLSEGYW